MTIGTVGPGDDVEAWCTRCKMNLEHRVIACVGSEVKRVHCLTCGSDHKYYPPRIKGHAERPAKTVRVPSSGRSGRTVARAHGEWSTFMREMPEGTIPRQYRISDQYDAAEYLEHPVFGTGRVLEILGRERIEVAFKEGRKVLICNKRGQ